jgi:hypothetical protein
VVPRVTQEDTPLVLAGATGNAITLSSVAERSDRISVTLVATHGTLIPSGTDAAPPATAIRSPRLTVVGTTEGITNELEGLTFMPDPDYSGPATLCLEVSYADSPAQNTSLCSDATNLTKLNDFENPRAAASMSITVLPVNDPPTLTRMPEHVTVPATTVSAIAFVVDDVDSEVRALTVRAISSNQGLLPNRNISFVGIGADRQMLVTPLPGTQGATTITVTVSDGQASTTHTVVLDAGVPPRAVAPVAPTPENSSLPAGR